MKDRLDFRKGQPVRVVKSGLTGIVVHGYRTVNYWRLQVEFPDGTTEWFPQNYLEALKEKEGEGV